MTKHKTEEAKNQSAIDNSNNSKNAKNGYMEVGNASKYAAKQGTRNKNWIYWIKYIIATLSRKLKISVPC